MRRLSESSIEFDASQVNIDYLESDTYKKKQLPFADRLCF